MHPRDVDLQDTLEALLAQVDAPGAVLAVRRGDDMSVWAAGSANLSTGVPMTADTLFPIASVSKVFTATLVMQLVDEGLLDLDRPVRDYLPGFEVADPETTEKVTARHLLTHTSGLDGDKYDSYGRGDDAIAEYVAACADLRQSHPLGATFSYCNSGFIVLGRLVEALRGTTFEKALHDLVLGPIGAGRCGMLPEHLIWRPLAAGHRHGGDGEVVLFDHWEGERSHGPAGGVLADAAGLLAFARMHLSGGHAPDGSRVLSARSVAAMAAPEVELPDPRGGPTHWGLGWDVSIRDGVPTLVGHGGDLLAHHTRFLICPEADLAVVLLTNGDGADHVARPLFSDLLAEAGAQLPDPLRPPVLPADVDVSTVVGSYRTIAAEVVLAREGDHVEAVFRVISEAIRELLPEDQREDRRRLVPVTETQYLLSPHTEGEPWEPVVIYRANGRRYLHVGLRAVPEATPGT
jgi:CubicO group peptidase (beta-lactamase class C family)